jgi:hypothetical protein
MVTAARVSSTKSSRIEALAFHPSGWLAAATNAGVVVELHPSGETTAFRGATRAIHSMTFLDGGRSLLVGGAEPNLRLWPVEVSGAQMTIIDDPKAKTRKRVIGRRAR